ncbi:hypothetical protein ACHAXN_000749, partial [Cyclotella atomus]
GKGYCLDSHKRLYSYLGEVFAPNISDTECLSWCSQVPHPDLVGGEIDRRLSYTLCNCNFGGGRIPSDVAYADYNPDATHNETEPGVGEIRSSQGDPIEVCYRYVHPISEPVFSSLAPSLSSVPSVSSAPSLSNSPSISNMPTQDSRTLVQKIK